MKNLMLGHRLRLPWWWIFTTFWLALLAQDDLAHMLDDIFPRPPWVSATVEIVPGEDGVPAIRYRAQAHRALEFSIWTAILYDEDGQRLASRKGRGDYRRDPPPARDWPWDSFFSGFTNLPPAVPNRPFRVCVNYKSVATSGAQRHGPDWCSDIYDPRGTAHE